MYLIQKSVHISIQSHGHYLFLAMILVHIY